MRILAALLLMMVAAPALAQSKVSLIYYSADRVVQVSGRMGIQTMIEFGADERIENIALGDSAAWQITPNKRANLIFLKPLLLRTRTNMTVVTDRRRYMFELVNGGGRARTFYAIRFIYPEDFKLPPAPVAVAPPPPPPVLNRNWTSKGDGKLLPSEIYDDGESTFIAWTDKKDLPAILTVAADGKEGPVNFAVKDNLIVIDGVADKYVLRIGKTSAIISRGTTPPKQESGK